MKTTAGIFLIGCLYQMMNHFGVRERCTAREIRSAKKMVKTGGLVAVLLAFSCISVHALTVPSPKVEINSTGEHAAYRYWAEQAENFLTTECGCQTVFSAGTTDNDHKIAIGYNCSACNDYNIVFRFSSSVSYDGVSALVGSDPEGECPGEPGKRKFLDENYLTDPGDIYNASTDLTCMKVTLANSMVPGEYLGDETHGNRRGPLGGGWIDPSAPPPNDSAYTKLLLQSNTGDGSTFFSDNSGNSHAITPAGGVHHETDHAKFGSSSVAFDGDGDYLQIPDSDDWDFGNTDFTIDFWYRDNGTVNTAGSGLITRRYGPGYRPYSIEVDYTTGNILFYASSDNLSWDIADGVPMGTYAADHFDHFAVVRNGNSWSTFKNGAQVSTWMTSASIADDTSTLYIGSKMSATGQNVAGYLDELRISKGKARWVDDFTPPSKPYSATMFDSADYTVYHPFGFPFSFFINTHVLNGGNPFGDISTDQVQQIFSLNAWYWDDLGGGFSHDPIVSSHRHAHSATRGLLANEIMFPYPMPNTQHDGSVPPYFPPYTAWFNDGSSDMMRCIDVSTHSIGYADSEREDDLYLHYPNVNAMLFNGCPARKETILAGTYGFWSKMWIYRNAVDSFTGDIVHKMMMYASKPENIPPSKTAYWAALPHVTGIAAGDEHTVAVKIDGTVSAVGANSEGQCNLTGWEDIIQVAAGNFHTVGLKADGTVEAAGLQSNQQCQVSSWTFVSQVAAGGYHTVGLRSIGTVLATGNDCCGQVGGVNGWTDIAQVAAGGYHTVGLKSDGTVVAAGSDGDGQVGDLTVMNGWNNIIQVAAGAYHTVGLKSDGTVVAAGYDGYGQVGDLTVMNGWNNIIQVAAGAYHTVGLKSDGTVVAAGKDDDGRVSGLSGWTDIGLVAAGGRHTVGQYRFSNAWPDIIAAGDNTQNQLAVSELTLHPNEDDDGDGLPNGLEQTSGTLANDADTDDDGISDGQEDQNHNGIVDPGETDPRNNDTDDDGVRDGTEAGLTTGIPDSGGPPCSKLILGTDPALFKPDSDPATLCTDPTDPDSDGDGLVERQEDVNRNGRLDPGETDPCDEDTDNDGYPDGEEVDEGTDPLDPYDFPTISPPIEIDTIDPPAGYADEDTTVTITGANFEPDSVFALYGGGPYTAGLLDTDLGAIDVALSGGYAYVADGASGLQVIDVSDPTHPVLSGTCDTPYYARGVAVAGNYAYVADGTSGLQVIDISNPTLPVLSGTCDTPGYATEVAVAGSYAYVADGLSGLQVIDISNPLLPDLKTACDTPGCAQGVAVDAVRNYAYVADGASGLQVIDISDPLLPDLEEESCDTPGYASNVFIAGNHAYVADRHGGLQVIDVSDPQHPTFEGARENLYAFDAYVIGDRAYVTSSQISGTSIIGLKVIDISDPTDPTVISHSDASHPLGLWVSGDYAYVADGSAGLRVIDVSTSANPSIAGTVDTMHFAFDVKTRGDYAYVADGASGLQVIDISDRYHPQLKRTCDTPGQANRVAVAGSYAYVADGWGGLQVIDISDPLLSSRLGEGCDTPGSAKDVVVAGNYAYVADGSSGLQVIDISDPEDPPVIAGACDTPGFAYGVDVDLVRNRAYVADGWRGLRVIDISNPLLPNLTFTCDTPGQANRVAVAGSYAYVADGWGGLQVIDISDPEDPPVIAGACDTPGYAYDVFIDGNYAYITHSYSGIVVVDISDPENPFTVGASSTMGWSYGVFVSGNSVYVAAGYDGLCILDAFAPLENIQFIDSGTVTATLPAGYTPGDYHLHGSSTSGSYATIGNIYEVQEEDIPGEPIQLPAISSWYNLGILLMALSVWGFVRCARNKDNMLSIEIRMRS